MARLGVRGELVFASARYLRAMYTAAKQLGVGRVPRFDSAAMQPRIIRATRAYGSNGGGSDGVFIGGIYRGSNGHVYVGAAMEYT